MKSAVQIALYNSSGRLPRLFDCLRAQTDRDWQLFLYDNSCDQAEQVRVREVVAQSRLPIRLTIGEKNLGFTAHNEMWRQHEAEFVFILNDDIELKPDYFEKCLARLQSDPNCASVTGLLYREGGELVDTAGLEYGCLGKVSDRWAGKNHSQILKNIGIDGGVFGVSCVAALFRRAAVEAVSPEKLPFDPSFFMYKEDVDLAIRLRRHGFTSWFEPLAVGIHLRGVKQTRGWLARMRDERRRPLALRKQMYVNQWAIYFYHLFWALGWRDILLSICNEKLRGLALFFLGSPAAFVRSWFRILKNRKRLLERRKQLEILGLGHIRMDCLHLSKGEMKRGLEPGRQPPLAPPS